MKLIDLKTELSGNTYPGRGIVIGMTPDGKNAVIGYFTMGRSVNSRNRVFVAEGDAMRTKAFDESKMTDPHLIIYFPVRVLGNKTIVNAIVGADNLAVFYYTGFQQKSFIEGIITVNKP